MCTLTRKKGFTLIEMSITMAVFFILMAALTATYDAYIKKARRADAINTLLSISLSEEAFRSNNTTYGSLSQVWTSSVTPEGHYDLAIPTYTATAYTITATGKVGTTQYSDTSNATSCRILTLSVSAGTITKSPAVCWPK